MEVVYHPSVREDVEEALTYYRKISGRLADEFHAELRGIINPRVTTFGRAPTGQSYASPGQRPTAIESRKVSREVDGRGRGTGVSSFPLTPTLSPRGEGAWHSVRPQILRARAESGLAPICCHAGCDSPSPWGRGPG